LILGAIVHEGARDDEAGKFLVHNMRRGKNNSLLPQNGIPLRVTNFLEGQDWTLYRYLGGFAKLFIHFLEC
jgi:hypothetical protein